MILHCLLLLPHVWATAAADVATTHTEQTCQGTCDGDVARGKTLLSLKADMAVKSVVAADTESIFKDVVESFQENATAMNVTNASWDRVNQSLQNLAACLGFGRAIVLRRVFHIVFFGFSIGAYCTYWMHFDLCPKLVNFAFCLRWRMWWWLTSIKPRRYPIQKALWPCSGMSELF